MLDKLAVKNIKLHHCINYLIFFVLDCFYTDLSHSAPYPISYDLCNIIHPELYPMFCITQPSFAALFFVWGRFSWRGYARTSIICFVHFFEVLFIKPHKSQTCQRLLDQNHRPHPVLLYPTSAPTNPCIRLTVHVYICNPVPLPVLGLMGAFCVIWFGKRIIKLKL